MIPLIEITSVILAHISYQRQSLPGRRDYDIIDIYLI